MEEVSASLQLLAHDIARKFGLADEEPELRNKIATAIGYLLHEFAIKTRQLEQDKLELRSYVHGLTESRGAIKELIQGMENDIWVMKDTLKRITLKRPEKMSTDEAASLALEFQMAATKALKIVGERVQ